MAIGTTIVSGTKDDRFDVDALVELNVPSHWSPKQTLDLLYLALQGFPEAKRIERCTRCVQIQFAFMHMDVTVLDPHTYMRVERSGEIFHSPDNGPSKRVPANPYGFSKWFRENADVEDKSFIEAVSERRIKGAIDRLTKYESFVEAEQEDLPSLIPSRLDSLQAVALKLLKRYLALRYEHRNVKRPPPIYLSKLAIDVNVFPYGLTAQLTALSQYVLNAMEKHIYSATRPDERNPSYTPDRLNDRWPTGQSDMKTLAKDMQYILNALKEAKVSEFKDIARITTDLFGEKVSRHSIEAVLNRGTASTLDMSRQYEKTTGTILTSRSVAAPAVVKSAVPKHHFHSGIAKKKK